MFPVCASLSLAICFHEEGARRGEATGLSWFLQRTRISSTKGRQEDNNRHMGRNKQIQPSELYTSDSWSSHFLYETERWSKPLSLYETEIVPQVAVRTEGTRIVPAALELEYRRLP